MTYLALADGPKVDLKFPESRRVPRAFKFQTMAAAHKNRRNMNERSGIRSTPISSANRLYLGISFLISLSYLFPVSHNRTSSDRLRIDSTPAVQGDVISKADTEPGITTANGAITLLDTFLDPAIPGL